jgi:AcrR family transcriptional regulator
MRAPSTAPDTRSRIIDAASQLFHRYGCAKTTVVDIAGSCRMSPANVYRFFPSKAAIIEAICQMVLADLEAGLRAIATTDEPADQRIGRMIERIIQFASDTYVDDRGAYDMVAVAVAESWEAAQQHVRTVTQLFTDVVASGIAAGLLPPQDPDRAGRCIAFAITGFWHPVAAAQCVDVPGLPAPQEVIDFILAALNTGEMKVRIGAPSGNQASQR